MISREALCRVVGIGIAELDHWVELAWLVPEDGAGAPLFREIDVARARLIVELRRDLGIEEETLPVVLSLLDQLYDARRQMRALAHAIPAEARRAAVAAMLRPEVDEPG